MVVVGNPKLSGIATVNTEVIAAIAAVMLSAIPGIVLR
jgi:hypothetical protein